MAGDEITLETNRIIINNNIYIILDPDLIKVYIHTYYVCNM